MITLAAKPGPRPRAYAAPSIPRLPTLREIAKTANPPAAATHQFPAAPQSTQATRALEYNDRCGYRPDRQQEKARYDEHHHAREEAKDDAYKVDLTSEHTSNQEREEKEGQRREQDGDDGARDDPHEDEPAEHCWPDASQAPSDAHLAPAISDIGDQLDHHAREQRDGEEQNDHRGNDRQHRCALPMRAAGRAHEDYRDEHRGQHNGDDRD